MRRLLKWQLGLSFIFLFDVVGIGISHQWDRFPFVFLCGLYLIAMVESHTISLVVKWIGSRKTKGD